MLAVVKSLALVGMEASVIQVEVDVSPGLPSFDIVGLPDISVKEARERVRTAIKNAGFEFPARRITVNLAPADLRKEGSGFDLPIAVGILAGTGQLAGDKWHEYYFAGELSLKGELRRIPGILPMAWTLGNFPHGSNVLVVPRENGFEGALIKNINVIAISSLADLVSFLEGNMDIEPVTANLAGLFTKDLTGAKYDFSSIYGQEAAKRGLEIAAAGGHNVFLVGPPGSGKTMLAKSFMGILPPLTITEAIQTSMIYSAGGLLTEENPIITRRPFRTPHHSASTASIIGGGRNPKPGEISLATHGVLFLDELPEFRRDVLESLRQPLEDRKVTVTRVQATYEYTANFLLFGSANPCPCGFLGDSKRECYCTPYQIQRYRNKLSGPLLDRIDLQIEVPRLTLDELKTPLAPAEGSKQIRERVIRARQRQEQRLADHGIHCNAEIYGPLIKKYCVVTSGAQIILDKAFSQLNLSMRTYHRLLKIGRTIADLANCERIKEEHIAEAIQYRLWDENTY